MKHMRIFSSPDSPDRASRGWKNLTGLRLAAMAIVVASGSVHAAEPHATGAWHIGPTPDVRAICHVGDSLWVGSNAGLFILDIRDPSRRAHIVAGRDLASNSVRAIASDGDSVWVATDAGVTVFHRGKATVFSARSSRAGKVPVRFVQHVAFGNRGEVLLATRRNGVGVLTRSGGFAITRRDSLVSDDVFGILERDGRPRLYACGAGLCAQVDDTTMVSFQAGAGLPRGEVRQVVGDARTAYVRIARRGIFQFDGHKGTELVAPRDMSFVDATSIALGADRALWVAGPGYVCVRRDGKWKRVETPAGINSAWSVVVADGAGAFVGSSGGVVLALNRGAEFRVTLGEGLPAPGVTSLRPDGQGNAWFVSGGRVVSADAKTRQVAVENSPLDVEAVDFSPAGGVVVASRWTVSRKGETGWTDLTPDVGEPDPAFTSVYADGGSIVWVGARSGALYRYDGEIWVRYAHSNVIVSALRDARAFPKDDWALLGPAPMRSVSGNWCTFAGWDSSRVVVDVAVSPGGEWFAATKDRLLRYDAKRDSWQPAHDNGAISPPRAGGVTPQFTALAFDPSGRLFIGTTDGFGCFAGGTTRWWNITDGIGGERVSDIATDASALWVGYGDDGLSVIPLANLR